MLSKEKRQLIVDLYNKKRKQQDIADILGISQQVVSYWIKRYTLTSSVNVKPKSGRPTKLTKENLEKLKEIIKNKIKKKNQNFGSLNTKQLRNIIYNTVGKMYSIRHVERLMHKLGFSLITPRTQHIKHDQEKVDNFRVEFKKNFNKSIWVMKL